MADKSIDQLNAAEKIYATDLFVLQQSGSAKKLTGQVLLNWLTAAADGHGGIQSISKLNTSGFKDTYRITMADTTTFDFVVTNGRSITSITQTSVSGLTRTYTIAFNDASVQTFTVTDGRSITDIKKTGTNGLTDTYTIRYNDGTTSTFTVNNGKGVQSFEKVSSVGLENTYRITYNDGTYDEFTVTNGAKGDKGDNSYVWIKYASQEPTESSHSIGDIPDNWIGIYSGNSSTAPTDWNQYKWFQIKGAKGNTGDAATLVTKFVTYQASDSGTIIPSGSWVADIPVVAQGKYLWTKTELKFNTGDPIVSYSVARMGLDGSGSVSSVNNVSPGETGNVTLTAADVGALPLSGGAMTGAINMGGNPISGLNDPTGDTQAARKRYVDASVRKAAPRNLLDNSDFTNLVAQAGYLGKHGSTTYLADRWFQSGQAQRYDPETRTISFNSESLSVIDQIVGCNVVGKPLTLAIKTSYVSGAVNLTEANAQSGHADVPINTGITIHTFVGGESTRVRVYSGGGGSIVIDWIALYEGTYTAETLPEYQPKGYGAELLECQRYYLHGVGKHCPGLILADGSIKVFVPTPATMRTMPTATAILLDNAVYSNGGKKVVALNSIASVELKSNGVYVVFNTDIVAGVDAFCTVMTYGTTLRLSADL